MPSITLADPGFDEQAAQYKQQQQLVLPQQCNENRLI